MTELSRADELIAVLRAYERWEAEVLMDSAVWGRADGRPVLTLSLWDELLAIQTQRNRVLADEVTID